MPGSVAEQCEHIVHNRRDQLLVPLVLPSAAARAVVASPLENAAPLLGQHERAVDVEFEAAALAGQRQEAEDRRVESQWREVGAQLPGVVALVACSLDSEGRAYAGNEVCEKVAVFGSVFEMGARE